jgi:hypothetical protein
MAFPIFRLANLVKEFDVDLTGYNLDECVEKADEAMYEFDGDFREWGRLGYFWRPTRGDIEPLNHALSAGRAYLELARLKNDSHARRRAEKLARFFRWAIWEDRHGSYVWAYQPTATRRKTRRPNLVWKADVDVSFALLAEEHGIVFDREDIERFCRTFWRNIRLPDGSFNSYIGHDKVVPLEEKQVKGRRKPHGFLTWNKLGRYDSKIGWVIDNEVSRNVHVFDEGWFGSARSAYAYALRLLYCRK